MLIRRPLFYMTDPAGAGSGDPAGVAAGGAPPAAGGDPAGGKPAGAEPEPSGKTFTEADVERIIAGRLSKFGDYDQIKQQLTELQQANQSESEKALNAAKDEGRKEALIEAGSAVALEVFNGAAGRRNADYDTAPALSLIDLKKFVKDDGSVDRDAIKTAVEQLVPEKVEQKVAPTFGGGARKSDSKPEATPGIGRLRAAYSDTAK